MTTAPSADGRVASRRVADHLRDLILSGEMPPGARIMQEEIARATGSSRLPVREALRIVEAEGLIELKSNTGAWVCRLDQDECSMIYKLRERVEPLVLAESMPHLSAAQLDELEEIESRIEDGCSMSEFLALDRQFHLTTYAGCSNELLCTMTTRFWNTTQHYRRAYMSIADRSISGLVHHEHRLLIDAIRRQDAVDGERFLAGHIRRTRLALERHPEVFGDHTD